MLITFESHNFSTQTTDRSDVSPTNLITTFTSSPLKLHVKYWRVQDEATAGVFCIVLQRQRW